MKAALVKSVVAHTGVIVGVWVIAALSLCNRTTSTLITYVIAKRLGFFVGLGYLLVK